MREQEYIDKFDRVLRYYVRPLLVEVIHRISKAHLLEFDLVNEYCEDNKLEYAGAKPKRKANDQVILKNLYLGKEWTNERIQEIAKQNETSEEREQLITVLTRGMDVQAAMRLFLYRWLDVRTMGTSNMQSVAEAIGVEERRLDSIRTALNVLIFARNKSGAHYTDNSDISKEEYDRKMQYVGILFQELRFLDETLFQEYEELYEVKVVQKEEEKEEEKKPKKKWILWAIIAAVAVLILTITITIAIVASNDKPINNTSSYFPEKVWGVKENGKVQMYPNEIYFENDQLILEIWVGNGTDTSIQSVDASFELQNSAGKKIVKMKDYEYKFSEELKSGEATLIKMRFNSNEVWNHESDLRTVLWYYDGIATELKSKNNE